MARLRTFFEPFAAARGSAFDAVAEAEGKACDDEIFELDADNRDSAATDGNGMRRSAAAVVADLSPAGCPKRVLAVPTSLSRFRREALAGFGPREGGVEFLDGAAARLETDKEIGDHRQPIPSYRIFLYGCC